MKIGTIFDRALYYSILLIGGFTVGGILLVVIIGAATPAPQPEIVSAPPPPAQPLTGRSYYSLVFRTPKGGSMSMESIMTTIAHEWMRKSFSKDATFTSSQTTTDYAEKIQNWRIMPPDPFTSTTTGTLRLAGTEHPYSITIRVDGMDYEQTVFTVMEWGVQ